MGKKSGAVDGRRERRKWEREPEIDQRNRKSCLYYIELKVIKLVK